MEGLKIIKAAPLSAIQDLGRFGCRRWGIPQSGFMDPASAQKANSLLGKHLNSPLIEFALGELVVKATINLKVAVVGAGSDAVHFLAKDQDFSIPKPKGVYAYLAVSGQIQGCIDFGSMSTYPTASFGGIDGSYLKKHDFIEILPANDELFAEVPPVLSSSEMIRICKGPEWHLLKEDFFQKEFKISPESNRMAIKLEGELAVDATEMISSAVFPGVVQLPPGKSPMVLMNDCQTTGGYPRVAKVLDPDLGRLAQIPFGASVSFQLMESS